VPGDHLPGDEEQRQPLDELGEGAVDLQELRCVPPARMTPKNAAATSTPSGWLPPMRLMAMPSKP
jgi:hypothetical protein